MEVKVIKQEGYNTYVRIMTSSQSGEVAHHPETIQEWIDQLRVVKAWLTRKQSVPAKKLATAK